MNILTFDIEEWFHCDFISGDDNWSNYEVRIHDSTDFILDTLLKYNRILLLILNRLLFPTQAGQSHLECEGK